MRTYKSLRGTLLTRLGVPLALCTASAGAYATGFDLPDQDAFAIGRGMAFVATADNPSAIYYNPAGISQLSGQQVRLGLYGLYIDPGYTSPYTGRSYSSDANYHLMPQLYYTITPEKSPLSFGLGMYSPFGLSSEWPQDTGFRTLAIEGKLSSFTINPVASLKLSDRVSIGAGLTANYAELDLEQGLVWPAQSFDLFKFKGNDWAMGFNLGALWKVSEKVQVGSTFRSSANFNLQGNTEYYNDVPLVFGPLNIPAFPAQNVGAQTDFRFPLKVITGISYRPTPKWNLEFNADFTRWDEVTSTVVEQDRGFGALIPRNVPVRLGWDNSWYFEFGATHYFDNGWLVSAGYIYNQNSVPDSSYSPLVADLDRHFLSAGLGYRGKRWDFDVAYQFGYGPDRTVSGSPWSQTLQNADGVYDFMSHAIAVSVGFHF